MKRPYLISLAILLSVLPAVAHAQETDSITISTSYNNLLSNHRKTGMLDRILTEAFSRIGIKAELIYSETANSLADVNSGLADAEINRIEGMEVNYPNLVRVPESNMIMDFVAFSKTDFQVEGWESIRDLQVGIVKGWKIYETATEHFPNRIMVPTEQELFRMLDRDRIDVALYSKLTGYSHIISKGYRGMMHLEQPLARKPMYLYLHRSRAALAEPLAEALREMKEDGSYDNIIEETLKGIDE